MVRSLARRDSATLLAMRTEQTDAGRALKIPCDLCGGEFPYGLSRFAGRKVDAWGIRICDTCDRMNHDGLDPHRHPALMQRLKAEGTELRKLPGGFIAIPGSGH